ncbi:MAG TPA: 5'/3'-nucleotidase SurE [Candidatus Saccharimonadales bacterium]|nr:5'/3'-nucleotidase SurE [Candidatus Saccharimonadales bacterium]
MRILLTNDDGVSAPGLRRLARSLSRVGEVIVVAPETEMSASAHSLTLTRPLRARRRGRNVYSVDGTPTDCVYLALFEIVGDDVDLVVSGINRGWNLGDDITYSGTVSAALEGTLLRRPSFAVSAERARPMRYGPAAEFARTLALQVVKHGLPRDIYLNVNVPARPLRGVRIVRQGKRIYHDGVSTERGASGETLYRIGGYPEWDEQPGSDIEAFRSGYITITPLKVDMTDRRAMNRLSGWRLPVPKAARARRGGRR